MHARFLAFRSARAMMHGGAGLPCFASALRALNGKPAPRGRSITAPYALASVLHLDSSSDDTLERAQRGERTSEAPALPLATQPALTEGSTWDIANAATAPQIDFSPVPMVGMGGMESSSAEICNPAHLGSGWGEEVTAVWCKAGVHAGLEGNKKLGRAVLRAYQRSTLMPGGHLDLQATYVEHALRHSDSGSSFHTSYPIAAALSKKKYQCLVFLLAAYFGFLEYLAIVTALHGGIQFRSSLLRFTAVGLRNSNLPANLTSISSMGLLKDGCKVYPPPVLMRKLDNAYYALYDREFHANGFYFVTSSVSPDLDPIKWYAQTSVNNGSSWVAIASSVMMINRDGSISFSITLPYSTPEIRKQSINIDLRTSWQWIVCWIGANTLTILEYFAVGVAGMTGREGSGKMLWLVTNFWATIFLGVAAVGYNSEGLSLDAAYQWLNVIPSLLVTLGIMFFEGNYVVVIFAYGVIRTGASAIQSVALYKKPWIIFISQDFALSSSPVAFVFVALDLLNRKRIVFQASRLIVKDMELYNVMWKSVLHDNLEFLTQLKTQVQELMKHCPRTVPRQVVLKSIDGVSDEAKHTSSILSCTSQYPAISNLLQVILGQSLLMKVDSIDQLFVQAGCVHPLLLEKVNLWALKSDGCFPVLFERTSSFATYAEIKDDQDVEIKYGKLKSSERSIEKLARSYCMDVSRLVDVCRQTVIFRTVEGIIACLASIAKDPDIKILRIKNRLDPEFDARESAGYRDVALNLQIVTEQTKALGIDAHVCELQLMLQSVAELKSDEGHKRYVKFRNLRAE